MESYTPFPPPTPPTDHEASISHRSLNNIFRFPMSCPSFLTSRLLSSEWFPVRKALVSCINLQTRGGGGRKKFV